MVVVKGSWVERIATYPAPALDDMVIPTEMCAKAVLICRPNSHPFQERTLVLDNPVKVGRSVARVKPMPNNAIFDCKVLSRNHALLWYEKETGKFFLQDTKSSNGTFVNNNRLSSNECEPQEVSSGDIVQFGVDVVENNRKVTHGCIIATLKLYLPDGKEAKASPSITEANRHGYVPIDQLYQLNQVIQEAARREQNLENKLSNLQILVDQANKSANLAWQMRVDEERLLSRVATLESQLSQAGKHWTEEALKEEFNKLHSEKIAYQEAAKEALQKLHNEKLEAVVLAAEQERARASAEVEAQMVKDLLNQAQHDVEDIASKLVEERKHSEDLEQLRCELQANLDTEHQTVQELQAKLQQLTAMHLSPIKNTTLFKQLDVIYQDDIKCKEEMLEENDHCESAISNGESEPEQNHINLRVSLVSQNSETNETESAANEEPSGSVEAEVAEKAALESQGKKPKEAMHVTFKLPEDVESTEHFHQELDSGELSSQNFPFQAPTMFTEDSSTVSEKSDVVEKPYSDHVDSKTLKYQYQTVQNELKKQIERLERELSENDQIQRIERLERQISEKDETISKLQEEFRKEREALQEQFRTACDECRQLRDEVSTLKNDEQRKKCVLTFEEITDLEEQLVQYKERCAAIIDENTALTMKMNVITDQYNKLCNKSYNQLFFYVAPLVLMVLYLLISSIAS